jgi:hypothetical protein
VNLEKKSVANAEAYVINRFIRDVTFTCICNSQLTFVTVAEIAYLRKVYHGYIFWEKVTKLLRWVRCPLA